MLDRGGEEEGAGEEEAKRPPVIGIVGPTAIGKTSVGIALAERLGNAEILSADSVQVYRRLDIGSAKPTPTERARAVFHGIDVADPDEEFTLADYMAVAEKAYGEIAGRKRIALVVGGTGLYYRAATTDLDLPRTPPDLKLRERWRSFAEERGQKALHGELTRVDPAAAGRIHVNDTKRIIRALEVYEKTGRPLSEWHRANRSEAPANAQPMALFALDCDRAALYRTIERRVDDMMNAGFVEEVEGLRKAGYSPMLKSMQSLGYKQINAHLDGELSFPDAVESIKRETRHFARRQLIWFRADDRVNWIATDGLSPERVAERIAKSSLVPSFFKRPHDKR